jgi:Flp pilus assembly pilin Flp
MRALRAHFLDESGQAMTEYASITMLFILGSIASPATWIITKKLFIALQTYVDFYYYCLNLAVG